MNKQDRPLSDSEKAGFRRLMAALANNKQVLGERTMTVLAAQQAQGQAALAVDAAVKALEARISDVLGAYGIAPDQQTQWGVDVEAGVVRHLDTARMLAEGGAKAIPAPNRAARRREGR